MDLKSFKSIAVSNVGGRNDFNVETNGFVRASADGQTFAFWRVGGSPQGVATLVIQGNDIRRFSDHYDAGHLLPSPDGKIIYTARGRYTGECKALDDPRTGHNYINYMLPAVHGNYYLGINLEGGAKAPVNVFLAGDNRPLARLSLLEGLPPGEAWGREPLGLDKRLFFIPEAQVMVTLPKTNDEIVLHRFDVEKSLEKSGIDYLLVTSTAPTTAKRGAVFEYKATARAKKGGLTFKLESGPPGMQVSSDGSVTWSVPEDPDLKEANVIVTVRDAAGQETFHTFSLKLE